MEVADATVPAADIRQPLPVPHPGLAAAAAARLA
jgi:hypothetical protein